MRQITLAVVLLSALAATALATTAELWPGNLPPRTRDLTLSADGRLSLVCVMVGGFRYSTLICDDGRGPHVPAFAADPRWKTLEPHLAPSGRRLFFVSDRPAPDADTDVGNEDIWLVDYTWQDARVVWGEPRPVGAPVNSAAAEFFPSLTRDGSLYFTRRAADSGVERIMCARPDGQGGWREPEALPEAVNAGATRFNAFVDPDERYLIVCVAGHPENLGQVDYWIAFRDPDGRWRGPTNLGAEVNGPGREGWSPYVTPDGAWFYFMSARDGILETAPLTYARVLELHGSPGNGLGHLWRLPAEMLDGLRPAAD
ncbi:MAG: hypothetical protein R3D98_16565 [Candidatus Krumholzibacteriia bacterium]